MEGDQHNHDHGQEYNDNDDQEHEEEEDNNNNNNQVDDPHPAAATSPSSLLFSSPSNPSRRRRHSTLGSRFRYHHHDHHDDFDRSFSPPDVCTDLDDVDDPPIPLSPTDYSERAVDHLVATPAFAAWQKHRGISRTEVATKRALVLALTTLRNTAPGLFRRAWRGGDNDGPGGGKIDGDDQNQEEDPPVWLDDGVVAGYYGNVPRVRGVRAILVVLLDACLLHVACKFTATSTTMTRDREGVQVHVWPLFDHLRQVTSHLGPPWSSPVWTRKVSTTNINNNTTTPKVVVARGRNRSTSVSDLDPWWVEDERVRTALLSDWPSEERGVMYIVGEGTSEVNVDGGVDPGGEIQHVGGDSDREAHDEHDPELTRRLGPANWLDILLCLFPRWIVGISAYVLGGLLGGGGGIYGRGLPPAWWWWRHTAVESGSQHVASLPRIVMAQTVDASLLVILFSTCQQASTSAVGTGAELGSRWLLSRMTMVMTAGFVGVMLLVRFRAGRSVGQALCAVEYKHHHHHRRGIV